MSLGSLSAASCDRLCDALVDFTMDECRAYMQTQRQVCMFLSTDQTSRISTHFQVLGARGVSIFGSSGDGGSHFSFAAFDESGPNASLATALNKVSCAEQFPVFPTASPYVISVGGTQWQHGDSSIPQAWEVGSSGSGAGFSRQFNAPNHQAFAVQQYLQYLDAKNLTPPIFNQHGRAYPDISAVGVQGTSMSCPIVAGIFSLILERRYAQGLPPLGLITPRLYGLYDALAHQGGLFDPPFDDVPTGESSTSCDNGFTAQPGAFDVITGFGRPNWPNLLRHFATDSSIPPVSSSFVKPR